MVAQASLITDKTFSGPEWSELADFRRDIDVRAIQTSELKSKAIQTSKLVEQCHQYVEAWEKLYLDHGGSPPSPSDLTIQTDDAILNLGRQCAVLAELFLDQIEHLDESLSLLSQLRKQNSLWIQEAETLHTKLAKLVSVLKWSEHACRIWSNECCDEYIRRHPELAKLPFDPIDLGPTNAARLPPVL